MSGLRIVRAAALLQARQLAVDLFMLFGAVAQPFFVGVTVMYMLRERPDFDPVYVVVGAALSGLWTVALFDGANAVNRERWQGTLELLVAAPAPIMLVAAGKLVGSMAFSLASVVTSYLIGAWLFRYDIGVRDLPGFVVSLLLGLVSLWSIGMLFAPIGVLSRVAGRFLNVMEYPVYMLSGFMFPILLLPGWLTPASYALPPYWAAEAMHATSSGTADPSRLALAWGVLVLSTPLLVASSHFLFQAVLVRARRDGTLPLA